MRGHSLLVAGLLLAGLAVGASANIPDPAHSTVPTRIVMCPEGDLSAEVVARDYADIPVSGATIILDFAPCSAFVHCAQPIPQGITNVTVNDVDRFVIGTADADGRVVFRVKMAGSCTDAQGDPIGIFISANGIPLGPNICCAYFMSPDQNGDLVVDAADEAIVTDKIANPTPSNIATADFNGDGVLDGADLAFLQAHLSHVCDDSTPVRRTGWGKLKLLYR